MTQDNRLRILTRREFLKNGTILLSGILATCYTRVFVGLSSQKRIYIAPDDHTDYYWSGGEETYQQAFLEMLDFYLDQADQTQGNPSDFQSRWNCDGSFWIWTYEKNRTAAQFNRLIERIRDGHISLPLNALVVCLGGAPLEAVLRGMFYAGKLERRFGLRFPMAIAMENQTLPYGLISLWAGSGAKYSWKGICNCDTQIYDYQAWDREHDIYWATGPDGSKVLMKWNSMLTGSQYPGGYAEARYPSAVVDYVDSDPGFIARYPYSIIGAFGTGWDDLKTFTKEFVSVAQSKSNQTRRVIVSNEQDFFEDFEVNFGSEVPSVACSFGNEWDLYCAALAEVSAKVKRSVEKLRGAEALETLTRLSTDQSSDPLASSRENAWMDLGLFWEHNFGMVGPPSGLINERISWQKRLASEIKSYVDTLESGAVKRMGSSIKKTGSNIRFFAFNCLSWSRTGIAEIPYADLNPVHVFDLNEGQETPSQIVNISGKRYLRILAKDVPSLGYKVFEVIPGQGSNFSDAASVSDNVIENTTYRVTLDGRGAITSLIDKNRSNRQFVRLVNGRAINDLGPGSGAIVVENAGPVSVTLKATANDPLGHTTRLTFVRDTRIIEIQNEINENFTTIETWGFGFEIDNPDVWHEEVGAVIRARLLSQGGHYSDRTGNARYDWLTLNHFVDMSGGGVGITISNPDCYFMKLGNSTVSNLDTATPQISVLAGGRVVNGENGLPGQGDDDHFLQRFALQTHDLFDPVVAMKFALEHQNPMVTGLVDGGDPFPEHSFSFLTVSNSNVLLWALKPAEDGIDQGIVIRLWNLSNSPADFSVSLGSKPIWEAVRTTHIETEIGPAVLQDGRLVGSLAPQQIATYRISPIEKQRNHLPFIQFERGFSDLSVKLLNQCTGK